MGYQIEGKVALITGGTGGIGAAIAEELLAKGLSGVSLVDLNPSGEIDSLERKFGKDKILFVRIDITDKKQLEEAFEATAKRFHKLDIVVNNAGTLEEVNWEKTLVLNLEAVIRGSFLAMEKYLPLYKSANSEGIVVNTASVIGIDSSPVLPVYSATKSAVITFGKCLGHDAYFSKYHVRVLTVLPGNTATPILNLFNETRAPMMAGRLGMALLESYCPVQAANKVGQAVVHAIEVGRNGSLWVSEKSELPYEIVVPCHEDLRVKTVNKF